MIDRYFADTWNSHKVWRVTEINHGMYLRQIINGKQFGRGIRTNKKQLESIGITGMRKIAEVER